MENMNKLPKNIKEVNINWVDVDDMVTISTYQKKTINQINRLAESCPDDVRIVAKNEDGTICAHLPKSYVRVLIKEPAKRSKRELTDDQKAANIERLRKATEERVKKARANG